MIRLLLVDDHRLVRQGVSALLLKAKDIEIVGDARDGQEALEQEALLHPDIILMDIEMPRMDGLRATAELLLRHASAKVLILSMRSDQMVVRQAAQSGAKGYLFKNSNRDELIDAIRTVHGGGSYCSPGLGDYFSATAPQD